MNTVQDIYNRLNEASPVQMVREYLSQNSKAVADENRDQLLHAKTADGGDMIGYRFMSYERYKQSLNPLAGGLTDLKLTGAFHRSIIFDPNSEEIRSTEDPNGLVSKYGDEVVFGLNDKSRENYVAKNEEKFIEYYRNLVEL